MKLKLEYSLVKPDDPILRQKTLPVSKPGFETILAYQTMVDLLKKNRYKWIALAAPQVGCNQSFFVSDFVLLKPGNYECFINPRINPQVTSDTLTPDWVAEEMCASLPNTRVDVPRWRKVSLHYTTLEGEKKMVRLEGMQARCAQHEVDHLNGVLITDYLVEMPSNELGS